jgi:hypothetical protein
LFGQQRRQVNVLYTCSEPSVSINRVDRQLALSLGKGDINFQNAANQLGNRWPLGNVECQAAVHQVDQLLVLLIELVAIECRQRALDDEHGGVHRYVMVGSLKREQLVEHHAERPDIAALVVAIRRKDFGRQKAGRADDGVRRALIGGALGRVKVADDEPRRLAVAAQVNKNIIAFFWRLVSASISARARVTYDFKSR